MSQKSNSDQDKVGQEESKSQSSQKSNNKKTSEQQLSEILEIISKPKMFKLIRKTDFKTKKLIADFNFEFRNAIVRDSAIAYQNIANQQEEIEDVDKLINIGKGGVKLPSKIQISNQLQQQKINKYTANYLTEFITDFMKDSFLSDDEIQQFLTDKQFLSSGNINLLYPSLKVDPQEGFEEDLKRKKILQAQYKQQMQEESKYQSSAKNQTMIQQPNKQLNQSIQSIKDMSLKSLGSSKKSSSSSSIGNVSIDGSGDINKIKNNFELIFLNRLAKEARGLNWNFFATQTGISRDQLMAMKQLPSNYQSVKDTLRLMMSNNKAEAEARQVVQLVVSQHQREQQMAREPIDVGDKMNRSYQSMGNYGQQVGSNNGILEPDNEILNEPGQRQQNISNATSIRTQQNNGVVPGIPDQNIHDMMRAIENRLVNRAKYLGAPSQLIQSIRGLHNRFMTAEAKAQPGAIAAEQRMEMQAQNNLTLQSQNAPEVLAQVPNTNGIINYRDQQENDKIHSLNNVLFNPAFPAVLSNISAKSGATSQQSQLLVNALSGQDGLMNLLASSNPDNLVKREQSVRNPFEESKGSVHSRSHVSQPTSHNSNLSSKANRRSNRTQQTVSARYSNLSQANVTQPTVSRRYPDLSQSNQQQISVHYPELDSFNGIGGQNRNGSNPYTQSGSNPYTQSDESFIFSIDDEHSNNSNMSIIRPSFSNVGNPSQSEIRDIIDELDQTLGLHLPSGSILASDSDLRLPFAVDSQNPGGNPFNNWFNQVFQGQNLPVNQQHPMVRNGIVVQRPAITLENFAQYLWQAAKFVSEISGPIQGVILKTYQKQTKVYQIPLEKKETTAFKIRPGAAYKIRACE